MIDPATVGDQPAPGVRRQRPPYFWETVAEVIEHRHLVLALARRDFTARYKQTLLGVAWALIVPLITIVVFSLFVQRFAKIDTRGVPYPLWSFVGLLPWTFFSGAVQSGGTNLLSNRPLLNKIYASRAIYPLAGIALSAADLLISAGALGFLFLAYWYAPSPLFWLAIPLLALNVLVVIGVVLIVSILTVYVRDLRNAMPVVLQLGLFATPIVYPLTQIPEQWRSLYCALNPMAPIIDSYRRVLLYGQLPEWTYLGLGTASTLVLLVASLTFFSRYERGVVDIL